MKVMRNCKLQSENQNGTHHLEDIGIDGSVNLNWILKKMGVMMCTDLSGPGQDRRYGGL
jgi:hypothetical protein